MFLHNSDWLLVATIAALLFSGCATVVSGSRQDVGVSSTPPFVQVWVNDREYLTPAILPLERESNFTLIFREEGYEEASATLNRNLNPWIWGNILLFPPIGTLAGVIIEVSSGAAWRLSPESLHVTMWKIQPQVQP